MTHELLKLVAKKNHINYFHRVLFSKISHSADSMRMTVAFFALSGLDLLGAVENLSGQQKQDAIEWIYRLQVKNSGPESGFQASSLIPDEIKDYKHGHMAHTYTALCSLLILGDNLERVDKLSTIEFLRACQSSEGCFSAMPSGCESDMRFVYCACCISVILNDWSGVNKPKAIDYILKSMSYEGAIGQGPGLEAHGGSTYCAIASLYLMNELDNVLSQSQQEKIKRWCLLRQDGGFQGRPGKPSDTCYSFWIGATLELLGAGHLINIEENREFVLSTQSVRTGGFSKYSDTAPDPLHTYLGLGGLSIIKEQSLQEIHPALNFSKRAYTLMKELHKNWIST